MKTIRKAAFRSLEDMIVAASEMVRPAERLSVSQATTKYRYLNNPGSYVGPWLHSKTPYLVEPMDELGSLDLTGLVFVGPARTGKSDMFFNWLASTAICDPADMMIVHMTKNVARDWSNTPLARMLRHSEEVGKRMVPGRQNNNVHDKRFKSGMELLIKWPVITELSGKTLPRVWFADYDRMEDSIDGEGPAFDLGRKRTETYKRFGMTVAESSPGREVEDAKWVPRTLHEAPPTKGILQLYNRGDRRRWYWRCLHCRASFEPDFKLFNYPSSEDLWEAAELVTMKCPHCGYDHDPSMKNDLQELNYNARWIKDGMIWHPNGDITGKPIKTDIGSFWMKGPAAAFQDWQSLVFNFLQASKAYEDTGDEEPLRKTITADQGNPYVPKATQSNRLPEQLRDRAQNWGGSKEDPVVPAGVRFLIATIDVQKNAFVVQVHGLALGGDVYLVDMFKIRKSERLDEDGERHQLDPASYAEDWHLLVDKVIERTYPLSDESGRRMSIKMTGCDSGGEAGVTPNAYAFWRWLRDEHEAGHHRRFQLVKGEPSKSAPRIRLSYPDSQKKDRHSGARGDVPVLFINSNILKDQIAGMIGRTEATESASNLAGMVNFPVWAENWLYTQLTAEIRTAKGWENPRKKRNEAFDLLAYCIALCLMPEIRLEKIDWLSPPIWADEWERNVLVFNPVTQNLPITAKPAVKRDLRKLAEALT